MDACLAHGVRFQANASFTLAANRLGMNGFSIEMPALAERKHVPGWIA